MQTSIIPQAFNEISEVNKNVDTAEQALAKAEEQIKNEDTASINKQDTVVATNEAKKPAKQKQSKAKKVEWKGMFAIGINWLHPGGDSASLYRTAYDQAYASPGNSIGNGATGGSVSSSRFRAPQGGIALSAGIAQKQYISATWSWQLGLQYNLLTSKQWVGTSYGYDSATFLRSNNLERAYATGSQKQYQQFTHQLQLLPAINYVVQPQSKLPLQLTAGAVVAYTFSTNMLMHNRNRRMYEQSGSNVNRLQFGAQLGASLLINKRFQLGLVYQYAFSKVANKAYLSDFRWRQVQIQAVFSLSNHPKK